MALPKGPGRIRVESTPSPDLGAPMEARLFNYDVGADSLKTEHRDWLTDNVVPILTKSRQSNVELRGTASRSGSDAFNKQLSERRAKVIKFHLEQSGVLGQQIIFNGLGEAPARAAGFKDGTETDEDRAVLVKLNPPSGITSQFDRIDPNFTEDGFDIETTPRFLAVPAFGERRFLRFRRGESLRLRSTNAAAAMMVDPSTNRLTDELIVGADPTVVGFAGILPGVAFIEATGVNGARRFLLEVHSLLPHTIDVDFYTVRDSTNRVPTNRSRQYVDRTLNESTRIWQQQANVSFRVNKHEELPVKKDLGPEITNKETSAGKNFHILSDMIKAPSRVNVFLVWEWNPDDGNADAEVNKIGNKFIIMEDDLVAVSTPGRVLGHEIGHLFTLQHDDVTKDVLMFGGSGITKGRLRKREILQARAGI